MHDPLGKVGLLDEGFYQLQRERQGFAARFGEVQTAAQLRCADEAAVDVPAVVQPFVALGNGGKISLAMLLLL